MVDRIDHMMDVCHMVNLLTNQKRFNNLFLKVQPNVERFVS